MCGDVCGDVWLCLHAWLFRVAMLAMSAGSEEMSEQELGPIQPIRRCARAWHEAKGWKVDLSV